MSWICGADGCIGANAIAMITGTCFGMWSLGYAVGKTVAWVRAIKGVA